MKRLLSLMLVLTMALGLIPAVAEELPVLEMTQMPQYLSELVSGYTSFAMPDYTLDYDEETGILSVSVQNEFWAEDDVINVYLCTGYGYEDKLTYDTEKDVWTYDVLSAGINMDDIMDISFYPHNDIDLAYESAVGTNLFVISPTPGFEYCGAMIYVMTENGVLHYYGSRSADGTDGSSLIRPSGFTAIMEIGGEQKVVTFEGRDQIYSYYYDLDDNGLADGSNIKVTFDQNGLSLISYYWLDESERLNQVYWDRYQGCWLGDVQDDDGNWSMQPIDAPAGAPDPSTIVPPLAGLGNYELPAVDMSEMPETIADLTSLPQTIALPEYELNYDEEFQVLSLTMEENEYWDETSNVTAFDENGNVLGDVALNGRVRFVAETNTWMIDLSGLNMTKDDVAHLVVSNNSGLGILNNTISIDVANNTTFASVYVMTEGGMLTYHGEDSDKLAAESFKTLLEIEGELREVTFLTVDEAITTYSYAIDNSEMWFTDAGLALMSYQDVNGSYRWENGKGWSKWDYELGEYVSVEAPAGAPDPSTIVPPLTSAPIEPEKPAEVWYPHNTVCVAGLYLKDTVPGLTDKWYNVVPVDLSQDGTQVYPLVASGMFSIGRAAVTVAGDEVTVTYKYPQGYIMPESETLAWFTSLDEITTDYLNAPVSNAEFGQPISKAEALNGQDIALLFICNRITYRQPYYLNGADLPRYWPNSSYNAGYVNGLKTLLEQMAPVVPSPVAQ